MNITKKHLDIWLNLPKEDQVDYLYNLYLLPDGQVSTERMNQWSTLFRKYVSKPKKKLYYYMLTYTLDPGRHSLTESYFNSAERYIKKLVLNKSWKTEYASIVREGGDKDHKHTHWHVSIVTHKYIDNKSQNGYYIKKHGNVDMKVSKLSTVHYATIYMSKQRNPIVLKDSNIINKSSKLTNNLDPTYNSQINNIKLITYDDI